MANTKKNLQKSILIAVLIAVVCIGLVSVAYYTTHRNTETIEYDSIRDILNLRDTPTYFGDISQSDVEVYIPENLLSRCMLVYRLYNNTDRVYGHSNFFRLFKNINDYWYEVFSYTSTFMILDILNILEPYPILPHDHYVSMFRYGERGLPHGKYKLVKPLNELFGDYRRMSEDEVWAWAIFEISDHTEIIEYDSIRDILNLSDTPTYFDDIQQRSGVEIYIVDRLLSACGLTYRIHNNTSNVYDGSIGILFRNVNGYWYEVLRRITPHTVGILHPNIYPLDLRMNAFSYVERVLPAGKYKLAHPLYEYFWQVYAERGFWQPVAREEGENMWTWAIFEITDSCF